MPLFDDPVRATVDDRPVLWLGTESTADGIYAIVVGDGGHVSSVVINEVRAGFRLVDGDWIDADEAARAELLGAESTAGIPLPGTAYPPGTIFGSDGEPYTADGDPL